VHPLPVVKVVAGSVGGIGTPGRLCARSSRGSTRIVSNASQFGRKLQRDGCIDVEVATRACKGIRSERG
jgi:hypothetical protein